jgi:hypothetical protein
MARVLLRIEGDIGNISLRTLASALEGERHMLSDLDKAISRTKNGSLEWVVSSVRQGSIAVEVASVTRLEEKDFGREVTRQFMHTLSDLEQGRGTPPFLSEVGIRAAKSLVGVIGRDGAIGLTVSDDEDERVEISVRAAVNARRLTRVQHQAIGSIEGRLEVISIHGGHKFTVYRSLNNKAVACRFDRSKPARDIAPLLGERINVTGLVSYNAFGEPFRIEVEDIRRLRERSELPRIRDLTGSDPAFTGGLSSEDYVRRSRIG